MKRLPLLILVMITLAGCAANETEREVLDRFTIKNYEEIPQHARPPTAWMLWLDGDQKYYVDQQLWENCWMGDKLVIKKIGKDRCFRTVRSETPTKLRGEK